MLNNNNFNRVEVDAVKKMDIDVEIKPNIGLFIKFLIF